VRLRWHLLGLIVAAVVPVLLFSAAMIYKVADQQRAQLKSEIGDVTEVLAKDVDAFLLQTIAALEVLAVSNVMASDDLEGVYKLAQRVQRSHPDWANIVLVGPQGEHLLNLRVPFGARLPKLVNPDVYVESARSRQPRFSDLIPSGTLVNRTLTLVAVPVVRDDRVKYVLGVAYEAANWEGFLRSRLPQGMQATLLDRHRTIIARTLDNERFAGKKPVRTFLDAMDERPEGGLLRGPTLEGTDGFGAYRRMAFSGWTVGTFMPEEAIEGPVRASLAQLALGFAVLLGFGLAFAWLLGKRIARSIRQLADSVRSVGNGDHPLSVDDRIAEVREAHQALGRAATLLAGRLAREQAARAGLEAADKAKDAYLTMLAHELRNPLAPVNASLYVLEGEGLESGPARSALNVIGRQVGHLSRLLDDLLDVSRLASGKVELHREILNLDEVLRRAADDYLEIARQDDVELALELPEQALRVEGDPTRLAQIVGNLLQNSLRFTPAGGRIVLSLARAGASAEIRVRDSGAGIEPELLSRLFEPFTRGAQDSPRTRAGLGLGLAVVKGLAELHGGSVKALSAGAGKGAEFVVTLPARDAPAGDGNERAPGHA